MTYLVLARKWRPRSFDTLIGQEHVVRALTHALSTQRLHHAWLFTGTRGVGKTTLSRILAKSLNCETGITAAPCGVCRACTEIDTGRFVDYVELDAASNRGVDEMTQLLEQAVYAPGSGRFKVYMIDEVHMLTGHAFNAMLKTLEEPPPHVKFILATTDPQKIPVTVLSRCLQFNLKQMTSESIVTHLQDVLGQEQISYETPALRLLAQAAAGSMRDALSLTDQAIAYSADNLTADAIQGMLGTVDQRHLLTLVQALAAGDAAAVLRVADELAARGLSFSGALADLAILLSRIAIQQRVPGAIPSDDPAAADIVGLAAILHPDQTQLFYSVAVHSRQELSLAPDEYAGFVMACLRMLALLPEGTGAPVTPPPKPSEPPPFIDKTPQPVAAAPAPPAAAAPVAVSPSPTPALDDGPPSHHDDIPAWEDSPPPPAATSADFSPGDAGEAQAHAFHEHDVHDVQDIAHTQRFQDPGFEPAEADDSGFETLGLPDETVTPVFVAERKKIGAPRLRTMSPQAWPALAATLPVTGLAAELARQSEWVSVQGDSVTLRVAVRTLAESPGKARLCTVLSEHFGAVVQLNVEYGATGDDTAHAVAQAQKVVLQEQAEQAVAADPFVRTLIDEFGAQVVAGSIQAVPQDRAA
ncbi:MAG TPA: DNA polymerase III subunit gamma/tau [Candidimonas sp.]|nr:DNA polymerase III subunit gamma/tau [Candidimonas sp.]